VTALCRRPETLADLHHPALRIATGDVRDPASYGPLLPRDGSVFHLAGVRNHPRARVREMQEINVDATLALARQAGEMGAARFVHVATALIYGPAEGKAGRTEHDDLGGALGGALGDYARSKAAAVQGLRGLVREGLPAVIVCPSIVFGPDHPSHPNRVTSEIRRLLKGGPRIRIAGGRQVRNLVFVEDVIRGLLAAEERDRVGEEYLLAGEEVSPRDFGDRVLLLAAARGGISIPLPAGVTLSAARIADRLRGHDAGSGYAVAVQNLLREWRFSFGKAGQDLGYEPLPLVEGLARTIVWIRSME
jgi:dihydroflavonol-4-reductase